MKRIIIFLRIKDKGRVEIYDINIPDLNKLEQHNPIFLFNF